MSSSWIALDVSTLGFLEGIVMDAAWITQMDAVSIERAHAGKD